MNTKTVKLTGHRARDYARLSGEEICLASNPQDDSTRCLDADDPEVEDILDADPGLVSIEAPLGLIVLGGIGGIGQEILAEGEEWRIWHEGEVQGDRTWRQEIEVIGLEAIGVLVDPESGKTYDGHTERTRREVQPKAIEAPPAVNPYRNSDEFRAAFVALCQAVRADDRAAATQAVKGLVDAGGRLTGRMMDDLTSLGEELDW